MATRTKKSSAPLTFDLPVDLIKKIDTLRSGYGLESASEVVRLAMDRFDFDRCKPVSVPHRQISVRISTDQRGMLKRYAKKKDASVGELLRLALEDLPEKPAKKKK
ncbi:MAG TPA: CopG family transcriptional regulator [Opitutus sp.]|nr:CopG family transcriptional regulator [Opitutus sp.]